MDKKLTQKLGKKFPRLFPAKVGYRRPYPFHFECADGWYDIIFKLSDKLCKILKPDDELYAVQVKEKFGGLRFYVNYGKLKNERFEEVNRFIAEAESKSYKTCEQCGKPGKLREDLSWVRTLCDVCRTELDIKYIIE